MQQQSGQSAPQLQKPTSSLQTNIKVGYYFDPVECRYHYRSNGQPVSERKMNGIVNRMRSVYDEQVQNLTKEAMEGELSKVVYEDAMRATIKRAAISFAALGVGGLDRMTFSEYGRAGAYLGQDYRRLTTFADDLYAGNISFDQAQNRSTLYIGHQRDNYYKSRCIPQHEAGFTTIEKRTLGARVQHCPDCVSYHDQGWKLMGSFPPPGTDSVCQSACGCSLERRKVPNEELNQWLGTRRSS